jgi:hypothetical protein
MFLGIDTGFGYTKVVSDNEKLIFKTIIEWKAISSNSGRQKCL